MKSEQLPNSETEVATTQECNFDELQFCRDKASISTVKVPIQRDRRAMSRRSGQKGSVRVVGNVYKGRYWADVPGTTKRVRRAITIGKTSVITKPQAERWLAQYIEAQGVNSPEHLARSQAPVRAFGEAARLWQDRQLNERAKASSQRSMACELKKHILPRLEDTSLEEIGYPILRNLVAAWRKCGLSRKSIKNLFAIVRAVYNFYRDETAQKGKPAIEAWYVKWDKIAPPKPVKRVAPCFTVDQMKAIVGESNGRYRALFALASGSGARAGELFGLRCEDVDLEQGVIYIRRSVFEGLENTTKSDGGDDDRTREVPIDVSVVQELRKHLNGRRVGYVFRTNRGTPLRLSNVLEDVLHPILEKLNFPRAGMHAFRHGRCSHLVYSGVRRAVIRDWLGHSSDAMIDNYTRKLRSHHAPEMAKAGSILDSELDSAKGKESGAKVA